MEAQRRDWRPAWPCPVGQVWSAWRRGAGDPTYRLDAAGRHWRGLRTPAGPATLRVAELPGQGLIPRRGVGPGAGWALEHLPAMLGPATTRAACRCCTRRCAAPLTTGRTSGWAAAASSGRPSPRRSSSRRSPGRRPSRGFRRLARRHGEPAPGPGADADLWVQPDAATLR